MKKQTKVVLGLFLTIGVVGVAAYFIRQAKLLKSICVKAGNIDWEGALLEAVGVYTSGGSLTDFSLPLNLTLINNSNKESRYGFVCRGRFDWSSINRFRANFR